MSALSDVRLVARREFVERLREKSFVIGAVVSVAIIVAIVVISSLGGEATAKLGVVGGDARALADAAAAPLEAQEIDLEVTEYDDRAAAEQAVRDGAVEAALVDGTLIAHESVPTSLGLVLEGVAAEDRLRDRLGEADVPAGEVDELVATPALQVQVLEPPDEQAAERGAIAFVTVLVLYSQLIGYGYWVAFGVVEEKASRVIEVLAATVRPRRLLAGKVLGIGLLGFGQLLLTVAAAIVAAIVTDAVTIDGTAVGAIAQGIAWFVPGFVFFAFVFAGAGALVSRQEDLQNVTSPMTLVLVGALFAGIYAAQEPDSTVVQVLSVVPPFSTVVMPPRVAAGQVPFWEILLAVVLLLVGIALVMRLAMRIYTGGILRQRSKLKEALAGSRHTVG